MECLSLPGSGMVPFGSSGHRARFHLAQADSLLAYDWKSLLGTSAYQSETLICLS